MEHGREHEGTLAGKTKHLVNSGVDHSVVLMGIVAVSASLESCCLAKLWW